MPSSLDLLIAPIARHQGTDTNLPGFSTAMPPRRSGRGRGRDRLVMHISTQGNAPLSEKSYSRLLDTLTNTYFKTPGSSITAMRAVADSLNESFFRRNQRIASRGIRSMGVLSLAVVRAERIYLAQCGPTHAILLRANGVQRFSTPESSGGLGVSRATPIQYHQAEIAPGDLLILSPRPPAAWLQDEMRALHGQPLEQICPRLLASAGDEVQAVLMQIVPGNGGLEVVRCVGQGSSPQGMSAVSETLEAAPIAEIQPPAPVRGSAVEAESRPRAAEPPPTPAPSKAEKSDPPPKPKRPAVILPAVKTLINKLGGLLARFFRVLRTLLRRLMPDENSLDISPSLMLFIAVAVPLIIVTVASVIYFREGRARLHQEQLTQAKIAAEHALQVEDPLEKRTAWEQVIVELNEAETYGRSDESQQLRQYAYTVLDEMDKTERLAYQPMLAESLPPDTEIIKMVIAGENDLYLLDGKNGNVLRATLSADKYTIDPDFVCGPIPMPFVVGPLIDIAPLPLGEEDGATVMGMDANGMLLRCVPGEDKAPNIKTPTPPDIQWGQPRAFELSNGNTYILDPGTNAVWIYWGIEGYQEVPTYYFGNDIPPLQDVLDMAVSNGDLYLLHDDGKMTQCFYRSYTDSPTICDDPVLFDDDRVGYADDQIMQDTHFQQLQYMPPPDPSIYLFDPDDEAIYWFSMQLKYNRQYRPETPLPGDPSAFVVGRDRRVFIASGNQVYMAVIP